MPQLLVICLAPVVPMAFLAMVLWLDRLEETLAQDVDRRIRDRAAPQDQLAASLEGSSASSSREAPALADVSFAGSTNR